MHILKIKRNGKYGMVGVATIAISLIASIIVSTTVLATNFSGATGGTGCNANNMQDNSTMSYFRSSLTTGMYNAVAYTLNNHVAPTDIAVAAEQGSADGNTDVVYFDADYTTYCGFTWQGPGNGVIGLAQCVSLSGSECQRFDLRFDTSWTDSQSDDWRRALSCHETGHSMGLSHRNNAGTEIGCMPAVLTLVVNYSSHDIVHINANY